ncbi:lipid-A-disaccharide synthase domain protein [Bordetella holmesii 44057]|nr:lipid-A-disaccharide synthase domain protein [Bordetella holmesii 44057]EWM40880.1 lipid-A-disaccharide synthase domain protein [Bordetella holmesii 35009]
MPGLKASGLHLRPADARAMQIGGPRLQAPMMRPASKSPEGSPATIPMDRLMAG